MHSWFRHEKFTTVLLDNEVYGNTGGQESGMTYKGQVMKMSPRGKKDDKMDMVGLATGPIGHSLQCPTPSILSWWVLQAVADWPFPRLPFLLFMETMETPTRLPVA